MRIATKLQLLFLYLCFTIVFVNAKSTESIKYYKINKNSLNKTIQLNTEWEFYWNKLYSDYISDTIKPEFTTISEPWKKLGYSSDGYGLYVLHVIAEGAANQSMAVSIPTMVSSSNFWVNGVELASIGIVGRDKNTYAPEFHPKVVSFTPATDTIELALEVANFKYLGEGINNQISIGYPTPINFEFNNKLYYASFLAGVMFIMFIFFGGYFLSNTLDKTALYLALLCLVSALRIVSIEGILLRQIDLPISWSALINIRLITLVLMPTFGILHLYKLLGETKFKYIQKLFVIIGTIMVLYILIFNNSYDMYIITPFRIYVSFLLLYAIFISIRAVIIRPGFYSYIVALAFFMVFVAGFNDILYSLGYINTAFLVQYSILFFVFIQVALMSRQISEAYKRVENISATLVEKNREQEKIIEVRTNELMVQTANLKQSSDIKDKILNILAHDLRSPISSLSSLITYTEFAEKDDLDKVKSLFNSLKPHLDNLNLTIENLFVWAKSQTNPDQVQATDLLLNVVLMKVLPLYELVAKQKHIAIINKATSPFMVRVDPNHLELIIRNIVSNAIKFSRDGDKIEIRSKVVNDEFVKVSIVDTGIGISEENINIILNGKNNFTTFGTKNEKGTGLGLKLCKEYIELNGGKLEIKSIEGKGTSVCFCLPAVKL